MKGLRAMKLLLLILGIIVLNTAVLSPGLIGAEFAGSSPLATAFLATLLIMSLIVLLYGSHALIFRPPPVPRFPELRTHEEFWLALIRYRGVRPLRQEAELALSQLERMERKNNALFQLLRDRFNPAEMSYRRFASVITAVEELFYGHIRGILSLMSLRETALMATNGAAEAAGYLGANEEILIKLDQLLAELSRLGSANYRDAMHMPCMKEIDVLISQTRHYKP